MTETSLLPVEPVDREAAASFYRKHLARPNEVPAADAMLAGEVDGSALIQAFAKSRLAERERAAEISVQHARELTSKLTGTRKRRTDFDIGLFESAISEALAIATAIRSPSLEEG